MAKHVPRRDLRGLSLVVLTAVLFAACSAAAGPVATPNPSPTSAPSPTTTPTPTPVDVPSAFAREFATIRSVEADVSGEFATGAVRAGIGGTFRMCGDDSHVVSRINVGGEVVTTNETLSVRGRSYTRVDDGLWLLEEESNGGSTGRRSAIVAAFGAEVFTGAGTETRDGVVLHRLVPADDIALSPLDVGLTDPSIVNFAGEVYFLARGDGTPAGFGIEATWQQGPQRATTAGMLAMRYDFVQIGGQCVIEAPEDPWSVHESAELGYRMTHPVSWDVTHDPESADDQAADVYLGPTDGEIDVYRNENDTKITANLWFRATMKTLRDEFKTEPKITAEFTLPSGPTVRILELHVTHDDEKGFFQLGLVHGGDQVWELGWYSEPGNEDADRDLFVRMVRTFEPAAAVSTSAPDGDNLSLDEMPFVVG